MIRPIIKDPLFLGRKAEKFTREDLPCIKDLEDTFKANRMSGNCVGMAGNMIGINKSIIIIAYGPSTMVMLNPVITKKSDPYDTVEACLSVQRFSPVSRYLNITVRYQDISFKTHTAQFEGLTAQIIQHECDHLKGIVI